MGVNERSFFRVFDVEVPPYIAAAAHCRAGSQAACRMSDGIKWDWDRNSKIRSRHEMRNEQGYNFISGLYRLTPTVRP